MNKILFGLLGAGVVVGVACGNPTGNGNGCGGNGTSIFVINASDNHTFSPQSATVTPVQTICFQNLGTQLHTVTPDSISVVDSAWMRTGEQSLPPNVPYQVHLGVGDYYYHCSYHGSTQGSDPSKQMWGVIHVR